MMPMVGLSCSAALPLNSGLSRSAQLVILRPVRSGRMPSVSPLVTVGIAVTHSVGVGLTFCPSAPVAYMIMVGVMPCCGTLRPSGYSPLVNSGIVSFQYLNLASGSACRTFRPIR